MLTNLETVLRDAEKHNWRHSVYMDRDEFPYKASSCCIVLNPEDSPDPGEIEPESALKLGLKYILGVDALQDIVSNAQQQKSEVDMTTLIECFNYYVEHDAFLEL